MAPLQPPSTPLDLPWPEPLVIELIGEQLEWYRLTEASRRALARQHAAALREMVGAADPTWLTGRLRLERRYVQLGIKQDCVAEIDRAVFFELLHLAADRFRMSPRRRNEAADRLRAAIDRLVSSTAGRHEQGVAA